MLDMTGRELVNTISSNIPDWENKKIYLQTWNYSWDVYEASDVDYDNWRGAPGIYIIGDEPNGVNYNEDNQLNENVESKKRLSDYDLSRYTTHLKDGFDFLCNEYGIKAKRPKVVFHTNVQDCPDILCKTGYFDPNTNKIHLFLCDNLEKRTPKDVYRSFFHECIHYFQQLNGTIDKSGYTGDKISEDNKLIKLEAEAYLKGNLIFRKYTEMLQRNGRS